MEYMLLASSVLLATTKNIVMKVGAAEFDGIRRVYILSAISAFVTVTVFSVSFGGFPNPVRLPPFIVITSACFAILVIVGQITSIKAVAFGSVSASTLFFSCGFIIPTVFGVFMYREKAIPSQIVGVALILLAIYLNTPRGEKSVLSAKWLFYSAATMVNGGLMAVVQKIFRMSPYKDRLDEFLILSFSVVFIVSAALALLGGRSSKSTNIKRFIPLALLFATIYAALHKLNLWLPGALSSVILFPCQNGGIILLTSAVSVTALKERMGTRRKAAVFVCVAGIVLVSIRV